MTQRRAGRWILNNYWRQASVTKMLNCLRWRFKEHRRNDSQRCLFFKIIHGLVAFDLSSYVEIPLSGAWVVKKARQIV